MTDIMEDKQGLELLAWEAACRALLCDYLTVFALFTLKYRKKWARLIEKSHIKNAKVNYFLQRKHLTAAPAEQGRKVVGVS